MNHGIHGPTRTWTAVCFDSKHLCSAIGADGAVCTRVAPEPGVQAAERQWAHRLDRGFEPVHGTPSIGAHVRIDVRRWIELFALPRIKQDVTLTMRLLKHRGRACEEVQWTVNGVPHPRMAVKAFDEGPTFRVASKVGPEFLRELQRPHPSLSVMGCGQTVIVEREALDTLVEFAKVYSDLAAHEQPVAAPQSAVAGQGVPPAE